LKRRALGKSKKLSVIIFDKNSTTNHLQSGSSWREMYILRFINNVIIPNTFGKTAEYAGVFAAQRMRCDNTFFQEFSVGVRTMASLDFRYFTLSGNCFFIFCNKKTSSPLLMWLFPENPPISSKADFKYAKFAPLHIKGWLHPKAPTVTLLRIILS